MLLHYNVYQTHVSVVDIIYNFSHSRDKYRVPIYDFKLIFHFKYVV